MKARCAQCQNVFPVEGDGAQTCPRCGAVLYLDLPKPTPQEDPGELGTGGPGDMPSRLTQPPVMGLGGDGADVDGEGFGGAADLPPPPSSGGQSFGGHFSGSGPEMFEPTPWEQRASLGFFKGLFDTIIQSVKSPTAFFGNMPSFHARGALSYFWIVCGFSTLCSTLWGALTYRFVGLNDPKTASQLAEMRGMLESDLDKLQMLRTLLEPFLDFAEKGILSPAVLACLLLPAVLMPPVQLVLLSAMYHVCGKLTGAAKLGFSATMRAYAYSSAALLVSIVPVFGSNVAGLAHAVLFIVGMTKIHNSSYGKSTVAYLLPVILACCCGLLSALFVGFGVGGMMISGAKTAIP